MKGKDTMKTAVWMLAVLLGMSPLLQAAEDGKNPAVLLQEAIYQEETEGDLDKAIELYGQVLEQAADVERLAARATYQLGMCHLKKGDTKKAIEYFNEVISYYPEQNSTIEKAQAQLDKIAPETPKESVFEQVSWQAIRFIAEQFGKTAMEAYPNNLQANGHVYFVDPNGYRYSGGLNSYYNWTGRTISQKVKLCGMTGADYTFYDANGQILNVEFEKTENRNNHYQVYWIPDEPLAPGQFLYYGWSSNSKHKLPQLPDKAFNLMMQNHYGDAVIETFFLVLPKTVKIIENANAPSGSENLLEVNVYWWTRQVPEGENHVETVSLMSLRDASPQEVADIVEKAVLTISTCAETDPRVKESLQSLQGIREDLLVGELANYLDSETATIRRSAIYILWKGGFSDISAAQSKLIELCSHEENFTRGMATLALGEYKIADAYDTLVNMTLNDQDLYARRCGAYALGLLGDPKALSVLEKAQQDPEDLVKQNAQTAITMLTKLDNEDSKAAEPEPAMTQEMYNDIQPDGTIQFRNPKWVVNEGTDAITECRFINSDFVQLTKMTDEQGNPVEFTATHEGNIYRYHVIFDPPVMPGEKFYYTSEGTINGLVKPVANMKDTYRYHMTHSPGSGVPTLRIEEYLLPEGAELLSTLSDEMTQSEKDGRILLRVEKVIPAGGNLTTSFKYRLTESNPDPLKAEDLIAEGWKLWQQRKLAEAEDKFQEAVRNDPDNDGAYQGLGWAQLNQGKKQNAEMSFKKCVKLNPQNSAALNGLGWIEHGQGNIDMAIKWWDKAVRASKGTATASLSGLTQVYMDRREYAKAAKYYRMWLKAEPNNEDAKAGLEKAKSLMK